MVSFYTAAVLNNHTEGHTSYTVSATYGPKGFLIQNFKHRLNVIKQLGPQKHSAEMSHRTWTYSFHFLLSFLTEMILAIHNLQRRLTSNREERFSIESRTQKKLVIAKFFFSKSRLQNPNLLLGVDYDGILVWRCCPSVQTEYNQVNLGWTINSRGNERCLSSCGYCAPDQDRGIDTVRTNPKKSY